MKDDAAYDVKSGPLLILALDSQPGIYEVTLTAHDDDGGVGFATQTIRVADQSTIAEFAWSPSPQQEGVSVQFEDLSHTLKEMQPRLQLTEDQYTYWSAKGQALLVEFGSAHKIGVIHVAVHKIADRSDWIAFEDLSLIAEEKGA